MQQPSKVALTSLAIFALVSLANLTCRQPRVKVSARQAPASNLLVCQRPAQLGLSPLFNEASAIYRIAPQDSAGNAAILETLRGPERAAVTGLPPNRQEGLLFLTASSADQEPIAVLEFIPCSSDSPALPALRRFSQPSLSGSKESVARLQLANELVAGLRANEALAEACAWEINADDAMVLELDNAAILRLEEHFARIEQRSALFSPIAAILARRGRFAPLLQRLDQDGAEHIRPTLIRLIRLAPSTEILPILGQKLISERPQHAAWMLARLDSAEARSQLQTFLGHSDPELEAAALIASAGQLSREARSRAFDIVRAHLQDSPSTKLDPALGALIQARQRRATRGEIPGGEQLRLQAAGFALARANNQDRSWLRAHLDRLDIPPVADFLRDRLNNAFTHFDDPW